MEAARLAEAFEAMVGWPYASPGTGDERGIDCSGAFVRAFRRQGKTLYHGSNRMARTACAWLKPIEKVTLKRGMVVFKARDTLPPAAYQQGGKYYDPALPQDFYHVGLVTADAPLRIVHATPPKVRADSVCRGWTHAAWLKDVREEEAERMEREVQAVSVNLRASPSVKAALLGRIPQGMRLETEDAGADWVRVTWQGKQGYVMRKYLGDGGRVELSRALAEELLQALTAALKEGEA